jgi:hypothetical protein
VLPRCGRARVRDYGIKAGKTVEATLPANLNLRNVMERDGRLTAGKQSGRLADAIFRNDEVAGCFFLRLLLTAFSFDSS